MIDTSPIGIRALIRSGESSSVEFKKNLVSGSILRPIFTAFLNQGEGVVLFGVTGAGEIVGLSQTAASEAPDLVRRSLAPIVSPSRLLIDTVELDGKTIVYAALRDARLTPAYVQARYRSARWGQFFLQLTCIYGILSAAWWLGGSLTVVRRGLFSFLYGYSLQASLENLAVLLTGLTALFALLFNGSSYRLLPLDVLASPLTLYMDLIKGVLRSSSATKEALSEEEAQAVSIDPSLTVGWGDVEGRITPETPVSATDSERQTGQLTSIPSADQSPSIPNINDQSVKVEELLESVMLRSTALADRFERKTSTYMYMGVGLGILGLCIWFWRTAPSPTPTATNLPTREQLYAFIGSILPRVTILLFIELLAGFFLRQYRIGMEDFKFFFGVETKARLRSIAYAILLKNGEKDPLRELAVDLYKDIGPSPLREGETTASLEAAKSERNMTLETIHIFSEALKQVAAKGKVKEK